MTDPVRIGVTGHRDLADPEASAAAVDRVLDRVVPAGVPVEVVTSLAEGADRLVADRVLARPGARLVAVLPLEPDDYEDDFGAGSRRDFRRLLGQAARVEVTGPDGSGTRESAYERAGLRVVECSDLLLALWDGGPARGRGGTAEIVERARRQGARVEVVPVRRTGAAQAGEGG